MYDAHKIYDKKIIEYVIFEKEEKYKYIFSISDPYSNTLKKKKNHLDKRFGLNSNKLFEIVDNEGKKKNKRRMREKNESNERHCNWRTLRYNKGYYR